MKKQKRNSLLPQKLTRKERRALRNTHMPHTKASSRAVVTTTSDALRKALTEGFKTKHPNDVRIEFGKFLTKTYGMPPATAYSKLRYWHIEEWEVIGFFNMISRFIRDVMHTAADAADAPSSEPATLPAVDSGASSPTFPTTIEAARQWHAAMPRGTKMKFYDYIAARGMCRERFNRILTGKSTISQMKADGLGRAFANYVESLGPSFIATLGFD